MFCRFGESLEIRPVVVEIWFEARVDAAVLAHERRQRIGVGAPQLLDFAVLSRSATIGCDSAIFCSESASGRRAVFVAFHRSDAELLEQDVAHLRRGVDV